MGPNIVGIAAHFHDSSCCVLKDGRLVAAVEEERFSRVRHDARIPMQALRFCLAEAGMSIRDVDCVAYYEDPVLKLGRQLWMGVPRVLPVDALRERLDPCRPEREIRRLLGYEGRLEFVRHHESHAASAYYFSGFPDAAILTIDGVGEWATTTYGRGDGAALTLFEEVQFPDSIGLLYSTITSYLGFSVNDGEYKVMGLAPYGEPRYLDEMRRLIQSCPAGQYRLDLRYFDFTVADRMYSDALPELFGESPRKAESEMRQFHSDVARSLQVVLEDVLLEKARYLHEQVPSRNLCMAGGVALNCVANARVLRDGPFERLFVQPAASDAGGSLGAAARAHVRLTGSRPDPRPLEHVYLGPSYSSDDIYAALALMPLAEVHDFRDNEAGLLQATVSRLAEGKVLGWFHGRMEFGPRALGARSILADPRHPGMRDRINSAIKKRESFRPFAPAVLEERVSDHFDLDHPSPFMLETCQVKSRLRLPSITHVDGSARVQTVSSRVSPRFAALLRAFEALTECPILLNTSFNMRDEPIVCTPLDAMTCFAASNLDGLVLQDCLIDRAALPPYWTFLHGLVSSMKGGRRANQDVYTFA